MRRVLGLESLTEPLPRSAVTIGKFFAVHRGHQALLHATVSAARRLNALAVAFTFDRHPLSVLKPGTEIPVLAHLEERLDLIEAQGIDVAVVTRLTPEFLAQEPDTFVRDVLVGRLGAVQVLASGNFRFGHGARGDVELLHRMGAELGFRTEAVEPVLEGGERISSSRIAACVREGRVENAALLLGRPYSVSGFVIRGEQIGRQLGYPTANVQTAPDRLLPADGIYIVRLHTAGPTPACLPAVASLGVRPVLGGRPRLLEVYALDWEGDLYDQPVRVEFIHRLRDEQSFPDLGALQEQIGRDVQQARDYFDGSPT